MVWFFDHLDDVLSDMSVFHGVDDLDELPASLFVPRMVRLPAYGGAVAHALARRLQGEVQGPPQRRALAAVEPPPEKPYDGAQLAALNQTQMWGPMGLHQQTGVFDLG